MDKNVKVLIVLGAAGVGVYILYKGGYLAQWFPQLFPATTPATAAPTSTPGNVPIQTIGNPPQAPVFTPTRTTPTTAQPNQPTNRPTSCPPGQTSAMESAPPRPHHHPPRSLKQSPNRCSISRGPSVDGTLNMDQWDYYYTQVAANDCPVDPGSIDPGVYQGAGVPQRGWINRRPDHPDLSEHLVRDHAESGPAARPIRNRRPRIFGP